MFYQFLNFAPAHPSSPNLIHHKLHLHIHIVHFKVGWDVFYQAGSTNLLSLFHNPMKCEKWDTALTIMCPYHCNSRTHSIVIASHDFQLQTDWFKCKLEQFLLQYFPRPPWHFSRLHIELIFIDCFTPLFFLTSCCDNKIALVWNLWMVIIHGIICM